MVEQRPDAGGTAAAQDPRDNLTTQTQRDASRTAEAFAAFFLPYLHPGMSLLGCGCGPGSITLGLAEAVAPGQVMGVDLDLKRIEQAQKAARERGIDNVVFRVADIYNLPFPEESFDAAYEHQVFIHLPDPSAAAEAIFRVLKPGGFLGARDTDHDHRILMNAGPLVHQFYDVWHQWQLHRGSNHFFGKQLRNTLHQGGYESIVTTASGASSGTLEAMARTGDSISRYLQEPEFLEVAQQKGWADATTFDRFRQAIKEWANEPDSYFIQFHFEAVGRKP